MHRIALPLLTALLLATPVACRGGPDVRPDPAADSPAPVSAEKPPVSAEKPAASTEMPTASADTWPEAAAAADAYLDAHVLPPDLARTGTRELARRLKTKTEAMQHLAKRLTRFAAGDQPPEVAEAAAYRVGVLYLNLACELAALQPPAGLTDEQSDLYSGVLAERAEPLLQQARPAFARGGTRGAQVLAALGPQDGARGGRQDTGTAKDASARPDQARKLARACRATRAHWYRASASAVHDLEERCRDGAGNACFAASRGRDDRLPLLDRACELGYAEGCRAAGRERVERRLDGAAGYFVRGCELGDDQACLMADAYVDPSRSAEDARACRDGDALACLRFAQLTAGSREALVSRCTEGAALPAWRPDDARGRCTSGVWEACVVRAADLLADAPQTEGSGLVAVLGTTGASGLRAAPSEERLREHAAECEAGASGGALETGGAEGGVRGASWARACHTAADLARALGRPDKGLLSRACEGGIGAACHELGTRALDPSPSDPSGGQARLGAAATGSRAPRSPAPDAVAGHARLSEGCRLGYEASCRALAALFREGRHVPQSRACAAAWAWQTCSVAHPYACEHLGALVRGAQGQ